MINKYDIKYILKRVIIFFIIFAILSLLHTTKTKALSYYDLNLSSNTNNVKEILYWNSQPLIGNISSPTLVTDQNSGELPFLQKNVQFAGVGFSRQQWGPTDIPGSGAGTVGHRLIAKNISGLNIKGKRFFNFMVGSSGDPFTNSRYILQDISSGSPVAVGTWFPCESISMPDDSIKFTQFTCALWYDDIKEDHNYNLLIQSFKYKTSDSGTLFVTFFNIHIFFYSDYTQETIQKIEETNQSINNVNDSINNDEIDNNSTSSTTSQWNSKNASDTAISDFLLMPIHLIQAYLNGMNSSCTPFNLGTLFNHELILPCINIGGLLGDAIWVIIDILFSGFMILALGKRFVKIFNDFTNLRDNQIDEIYGGGNK